jgi:hypothetical protein
MRFILCFMFFMVAVSPPVIRNVTRSRRQHRCDTH